MSNLITTLVDANTVAELAVAAGITEPAARRFLMALGDLPAEQVVRLTGAARQLKVISINRQTRRDAR